MHIVDVQPIDGSDPAYNAKAIIKELKKFSPTLAKLPVVLVLNKLDQLAPDTSEEWCNNILEELEIEFQHWCDKVRIFFRDLWWSTLHFI